MTTCNATRLLGVACVLLAAPAVAADLNGMWRIETPGLSLPPQFVAITQVGDAVSFTLGVPIPVDFAGTVSGGAATLTADPAELPCPAGGSLRILPGEGVLDGRLAAVPQGGACNPPARWRVLATRCSCFDGNQVDGDGCDATCQTEPCFECTGQPSTCTRSPDGAACDDRQDCTAGTTCSAGACGGGTPLPACIDMTGRWLRRAVSSFVGPVESKVDVVQRAGVLVFRSMPGAQPGFVGTLDGSSGAMDLRQPSLGILCFPDDTLAAVTDGTTYSGTFTSSFENVRLQCFADSGPEQGSRCGGGTLDPGEACDDGNAVAGDGCDAACQVEPCFACTGTPSTCAPLPPGTICNDGNACTAGDACSGGTCTGTPATCALCEACHPDAGCVPAPRTDCRDSLKPSGSLLEIRDAPGTGKDRVRWRWTAGAATAPSDLGDPPGTSDVGLCVFDDSGGTQSLVFRAVAPAAGTCGGRPCWKARRSGFRFSDRGATADGIRALSLEAGGPGKAGARLVGRGAGLSGRAFGLPAPPLGLPLRSQLQVRDGACFETRHDLSSVRHNEPGSFLAHAVP